MMRCGQYEGVRELSRGPVHTVYAARRSGETAGEPFVIKTCSVGMILDEKQAADRLEEFGEQTALQERLAAGPEAPWARVLERASVPDGAAYVADRYDTSAWQLVESRVHLKAARVSEIVGAVVAGLRGIEAAAGRPHGNLKPTNVLVDDVRREDRAPVALTDPLPTRRVDPARDRAADLAALGGLIHMLVLHEPPGARPWPVAESPVWNRLGKEEGPWWRALCGDLLRPATEGGPPTLDEVAERLTRVPKPRRPWKMLVAAAALTVVLAVSGLMIWCPWCEPPPPPASKGEWDNLCLAMYDGPDGWFRQLLEATYAEPGDDDALRRSPALGTILETIEVADESGSTFEPTAIVKVSGTVEDMMRVVADDAILASASEAVAVMKEVERALAAWLERFRAVREEMVRIGQAHGASWRAGERLADLIGRVETTVGGEPRRDDAWLEALVDLARLDDTEAIEGLPDRLRDLSARADRLAAAGSPYDRFPSLLSALAVLPMESREDVRALSQAAEDLREQAGELESVETTKRETHDVDRFKADHRIDPVAAVTIATFDGWLERLSDYAYLGKDDNPIEGAMGSLRRDLAELRVVLDAVESKGGAGQRDFVRAGREKATAIEGTLDELGRREGLIRQERPALEQEVESVRGKLAQVKGDVDTVHERVSRDLPKMLDRICRESETTPFGVPALNEAWEAWARDRAAPLCQPGAAVGDGGRIWEVRDAFDEATKRLRALDERGEPFVFDDAAAKRLAAPIETMRRDRREAVIARIMADAGGVEQLVREPETKLDAAWAEHDAWCAAARGMIEAFVRVERALDRGSSLAEVEVAVPGWRAGSDDPLVRDVRAGLAPVVERLERLREMEAAPDRSAVAARARGRSEPELMLAAWRRLGAMAPDGRAASVRIEREILTRVRGALDLIPADARVDRAAIDAVAPDRWLRQAATASREAPEELPDILASANREAFGVTGDRLGPALAFNIRLLDFRAAAATRRGEALQELTRAFVRDAQDSSGGIEGVGSRLALLVEILEGGAAPDIRDVPRPLAEAGVGWETVAADPDPAAPEGPPVAYALSLPDGDGGRFALGFRRVSAPDAAPVRFLSADELSIEGCRALLSASGLAVPPSMREQDRRGVRGWTWTNQAIVCDGRSWIHPRVRGWLWQGRFQYPKPAHPMTWIPATFARELAGAIGCRLPTQAEWEAAAASAAGAEANLRDETWVGQADHVTRNRVRFQDADWQAPDAGRFRDDRSDEHREHPVDDGEPMFWITEPARRDGFRNLEGNVLEYVTTDGAGAAVAVIGKSALSPNEADWDRPQPIDDVEGAWADVGFRLAFELETWGIPLSPRVNAWLDETSFVPVPE